MHRKVSVVAVGGGGYETSPSSTEKGVSLQLVVLGLTHPHRAQKVSVVAVGGGGVETSPSSAEM